MRNLEPLLTGVLSAASSALNDAGVPAGLVHLAPGSTPAWDNCCEGGGQLWLRVVEAYPTAGQGAPFPQMDTSQRGAANGSCSIRLLALRLALGVMRCAHTINDHGDFPTGPQMSGDTLAVMDDFGLLLDTIVCEVPGVPGVASVKVDRWTPQGVMGGCAGGEWTFLVAWDPCVCAPLPVTEEPEP